MGISGEAPPWKLGRDRVGHVAQEPGQDVKFGLKKRRKREDNARGKGIFTLVIQRKNMKEERPEQRGESAQGQVLDLHTDHFRPLTCEGIIGCCFAWRIHPSTRQAPAHGGGSEQPGQPNRARQGKAERGFTPKTFISQSSSMLFGSLFCGLVLRLSNAIFLLAAEWLI
jgi:hypothetical protein